MKITPKILIVDDKPANIMALESTLDELDVEIISANSGPEALEKLLQNNDCALALLDVNMPEMDGYELAELMRGNNTTNKIPIIFITAIYSENYHVIKGFDSGGVDFISKPYNPEILVSKVKIFLALNIQKKELEQHRDNLKGLVKDGVKNVQNKEAELAFQAGLSEMGTNTLHNVGNAMTPVTNATDNLKMQVRSIGQLANSIDKGKEKFKGDLDKMDEFLDKVSIALRGLEEEDLKESVETINRGVNQTLDIIRLQQTMASGSAVETSAFDLHGLIDDSLFLMKGTFKKFSITIRKEFSEEFSTVFLPSSHLMQVINNFLKNSKEAIHTRMGEEDVEGEICITTAKVTDNTFSITVKDNGCGIPKDILEKIFKHGFSTKDRGSGFGLDSVEKFVHSINGTITVNSHGENQGAEITVILPIKAELN